jgi:hypothetical protein
MKFKIKHKEEGWTGTLEIESLNGNAYSSHRMYGTIDFTINQDAYDDNKKYHEDPSIDSLDELEIELIQEEIKKL